MSLARKLLLARIWKRIFYERLTEPIHLNLLALGVWVFGSFRQKVEFDLEMRPHNAYGLLKAADIAKKCGITEITALEFGVAAGAGLMNMARIAQRVEAATGVRIHLVGFDSGVGMPPPLDYRDHPEMYFTGDFPMDDGKLRSLLPENVELVLGELRDTLPAWIAENPQRTIGYIVMDVDYYSSTVEALRILDGKAEKYLPVVVMYFDDIREDAHNSWCGELLAISEFNARSEWRKIERPEFIDQARVFKRATWLRQIFFCHVFDHPTRNTPKAVSPRVLTNPYM
jgi:hypothetical protein